MNRKLGEFDYVIVGAGTAGCLLANRLSADPQVRVALIEAGGKDNYLWIHVPVGYLYCIGNPRTDWCFNTEAEPALLGRSLRYPRGKVLGGCSSINGMIYMRGQRLRRQPRLGLGRGSAVLQAARGLLRRPGRVSRCGRRMARGKTACALGHS
jgi:choline dehydrogenase-like flavoprotein